MVLLLRTVIKMPITGIVLPVDITPKCYCIIRHERHLCLGFAWMGSGRWFYRCLGLPGFGYRVQLNCDQAGITHVLT